MQGNQLAHLVQEHKSAFIEHHRYLISKYAHDDEEAIQPETIKTESNQVAVTEAPSVPKLAAAPVETTQKVYLP